MYIVLYINIWYYILIKGKDGKAGKVMNMKKLYFVETNGYNMVVSVDNENNCRYLTETADFPYIVEDDSAEKECKAAEFLNSIEDDSDWEDDCSYEQIFKEFQINIIAEIEKEL